MNIIKIIIGVVADYGLIAYYAVKSLPKKETPPEWRVGSKGDVLLIPGLLENWVFMEKIGWDLNQKGFRVHTVRAIGFNAKPVDWAVEAIGEFIMSNNLHHLTVIGHSKGGVIGIKLINKAIIRARISKLITIACPFGGSFWGYFWPANFELSLGSKLIKGLANGIRKNEIYNFYPEIDQQIIPNNGLILKNGNNQQIQVIGHCQILNKFSLLEGIGEVIKLKNQCYN
ncbi:MAG: hypothetical protein WC686_03395 [Candidatus Shapirobacteria bacterium]|jgi:pimeloyl-ACP methyl ester carboxylesterase